MKQDSLSSSKEFLEMQKMISCRNIVEQDQRVTPFSEEELAHLKEGASKQSNFWTKSKSLGQITVFSSVRNSLKSLSDQMNDRIERVSQKIQDYCLKKMDLVKRRLLHPLLVFFKWLDQKIYHYLLIVERKFKIIRAFLIRLFSPVVIPIVQTISLFQAWIENKFKSLSYFFYEKREKLFRHLTVFWYSITKLFSRSSNS
jgi:hypothetical protein